MDRTKLTLIAALALTAILASMIVTDVVGLTTLFTHTFPKTPHGI